MRGIGGIRGVPASEGRRCTPEAQRCASEAPEASIVDVAGLLLILAGDMHDETPTFAPHAQA